MRLATCSAVISFITKIEEDTAGFYEKLAQKYPEDKEFFTAFSKENLKNKKRVTRTYYGVISDALEACFSFEEGLDPDAYRINIQIPTSQGLAETLERAITIEETIQKAYSDAASLSEGLMADIPRVFNIIADKRGERIAKLRGYPR